MRVSVDFLAASIAMFLQLSFWTATTMYASYFEIPINYIPAFCKFWYYLLQSTSIMYRWMLAAACVDRYALSSVNPRFRNWACIKNAHRMILVTLGISIVFPIHMLVLYDARGRTCAIFNNFAGSLYNAIIVVINSGLIPVVVMMIFTLLIRRNLKQRHDRRQMWATQQPKGNREEQAQRNRDRQALKMLFVQIIVFIIIITPWLIYSSYLVVVVNMPNKPLDRIILEGFLSFVTGTLALLFTVISFYLYTLTSSMFRREFRIVLESLFCFRSLQQRVRVETTATASRQQNHTEP